MTFRLILNSLVGIPLFRDNTYDLMQKIKKEDLKRFIELNPDFNFKLYENKNLRKIYELDTEFKNKWESQIMPMKLKEYKNQKLHKNQILVNIDKDEKNYFMNYLSESAKFKKIKKDFPNLEQFLLSQQIINDEQLKFYALIGKKKKLNNMKNSKKKKRK